MIKNHRKQINFLLAESPLWLNLRTQTGWIPLRGCSFGGHAVDASDHHDESCEKTWRDSKLNHKLYFPTWLYPVDSFLIPSTVWNLWGSSMRWAQKIEVSAVFSECSQSLHRFQGFYFKKWDLFCWRLVSRGLKLIARVLEGSFMLKQAVGSKPAIIGNQCSRWTFVVNGHALLLFGLIWHMASAYLELIKL